MSAYYVETLATYLVTNSELWLDLSPILIEFLRISFVLNIFDYLQNSFTLCMWVLNSNLRTLQFAGIGMDACVTPLRHTGLSLVQTTDFFYPLVDDPYMQGKLLNNS